MVSAEDDADTFPVVFRLLQALSFFQIFKLLFTNSKNQHKNLP